MIKTTYNIYADKLLTTTIYCGIWPERLRFPWAPRELSDRNPDENEINSEKNAQKTKKNWKKIFFHVYYKTHQKPE